MDFKDFKRKVQTRQFAIECSGRVSKSPAAAAPASGSSIGDARKRQLEEELAQAGGCQVFGLDLPIHSHRRKIGKAIVFCKRALRKLLKVFFGWYIFPIYQRQSHFNGKLLNAASLEREWLYHMDASLAAADGQISELKDQLISVRQEQEQLASARQEQEQMIRQLTAENHALAQHIQALTGALEEAQASTHSSIKKLTDLQEQAIQDRAVNLQKINILLEQAGMERRKNRTDLQKLEELLGQAEGERTATRQAVQQLSRQQDAMQHTLRDLVNLPTDDDDFYHAFEEKFRGSREEIRDRLQVYVPLIREHLPDWSQGRFVDIGSGRGEWLDILRDNGAEDRIGIDLNQRQNAICESHGHKTLCMDAIEYLSQQPDNSLDLVSGIQIIEHLSLPTLMELLQQCHRALKPGGMILFETPNPRNLMVGADTFYMDLSHKRPLEPGVVDFMAEWSGFGSRKMIEANSHPMWEGVPLVQGDSDYELKRQFNDMKWLLYGPQDYALLAVKE